MIDYFVFHHLLSIIKSKIMTIVEPGFKSHFSTKNSFMYPAGANEAISPGGEDGIRTHGAV